MTEDVVSSIWLVPSAAATARLQPIIDEAAALQNGVSFQPHLTLGSLRTRKPDLKRLSQNMSALWMTAEDIDMAPSFTTSLFIRFKRSADIMAMREALEREPTFRASRIFDPHLSLCYGPPPPGFDDPQRYIALLNQPIQFDQLWSVEIELPVSSYDDVRSWRVIEKRSL